MLEFTVIAGPNGAGKSSFSKSLSRPDTIIFDPDKYKISIENQYPGISEEAVESSITLAYSTLEQEVLKGRKSLTVETNLRNQFLVQRAQFFENQGYQTSLIFMLLPDLASSMNRVNRRVEGHGHFVDRDSIVENFYESVRNLKLATAYFQNILLLSGITPAARISVPEMLLLIKSGNVVYLNPEVPTWSGELVGEVIHLVSNAQR